MSMKAILLEGDGKLAYKDTDIPKIGPKDILTKTKAVALNPTDWKGAGRSASADPSPIGWINGCDYSGIVEEVGSEVNHLKKGDRVAAFLRGSTNPESGAFAEYVKQEASLVWKIPDGTSFEEAATLGGISPHTCYQALYLKLELPPPTSPSPSPIPVLVWSASTGTGLLAVQLLRASNLTPITTSSPSSFELLKSLGAEATYDYNDPDVSEKIKKDYPGIRFAFDTFSEKGTTQATVKAMDGGKVVVLLPQELGDWTGNVEVEATIVYSLLGEVIPSFGSNKLRVIENEKKYLEDWNLFYPTLIASGLVKAPPLRITKGLEGVPAGLEEVKSGKVRALKLVYTV